MKIYEMIRKELGLKVGDTFRFNYESGICCFVGNKYKMLDDKIQLLFKDTPRDVNIDSSTMNLFLEHPEKIEVEMSDRERLIDALKICRMELECDHCKYHDTKICDIVPTNKQDIDFLLKILESKL